MLFRGVRRIAGRPEPSSDPYLARQEELLCGVKSYRPAFHSSAPDGEIWEALPAQLQPCAEATVAPFLHIAPMQFDYLANLGLV